MRRGGLKVGLQIIAGFPLLMSIAALSLWCASKRHQYWLHRGGEWDISAYRGRLVIDNRRSNHVRRMEILRRAEETLDDQIKRFDELRSRLELSREKGAEASRQALAEMEAMSTQLQQSELPLKLPDPTTHSIPLLPLIAGTTCATLLVLTCFLPIARRARWRAEGRCTNCGYDLRATPNRCPECGKGRERPPVESDR